MLDQIMKGSHPERSESEQEQKSPKRTKPFKEGQIYDHSPQTQTHDPAEEAAPASEGVAPKE